MTMKNDLILHTWSHRWPSIFNPSIIDEFFSSLDEKIFNVNSSYPYDIIGIKDQDGNLKEIQIIYALAGFNINEVNVRIVDNELKITAEKKEKDQKDQVKNDNIIYYHQGIAKRSLKVSFSLGPDIDKEHIKSKFINGILKISLPIIREESIDIPVEIEKEE